MRMSVCFIFEFSCRSSSISRRHFPNRCYISPIVAMQSDIKICNKGKFGFLHHYQFKQHVQLPINNVAHPAMYCNRITVVWTSTQIRPCACFQFKCNHVIRMLCVHVECQNNENDFPWWTSPRPMFAGAGMVRCFYFLYVLQYVAVCLAKTDPIVTIVISKICRFNTLCI